MAAELHALCFDASDPGRIARFWGDLLDRDLREDDDGGVELLPASDSGFRLRFVPSVEPKTNQNPMHFHLTSVSREDQQAIVTRALDLGAQHLDVGQLPEEEHVVLADPEGNEFCVIEPGNASWPAAGSWRAACDGTRAVGDFWSEAMGWPLVWDQDEETAIQSPQGGTKISWGSARGAEDREGPAALRPRARPREHPGRGGRPPDRPRRDASGHRAGGRGLDGPGRPRRQRVLRAAV